MSGPSQHDGLEAERWNGFGLERQVLMIANEMHRARRFLDDAGQPERLRACYRRVLRLLDLTVEVNPRPTLRRELLRLREVMAALYLAEAPRPAEHRRALRALLQLSPPAARQLAHL